MVRYFSMISHHVLKFIEPWVWRKYLSVSHAWNHDINEVMAFLDNCFFQLKRDNPISYDSTCHSSTLFKYPYEYHLIVSHDCVSSECGIPCHRVNTFGCVHWDITISGFKPVKCVRCGEVYLNIATVKNNFFLREKEIVATRYYTDRFGICYNKKEIQWLSLMIHGTIVPKFRYSKSRDHRENMLKFMLSRIKIKDPFTRHSIVASPAFRLYREGKWKIRSAAIYDRYCRFSPYYIEFDMYWKLKLPNTYLFSDMNGLTFTSHGFMDEMKKSLAWFLSESIFHNDVNWGLSLARRRILRIFRESNQPCFQNIDAFFIMKHPEIETVFENFIQGDIMLDEMIEKIQGIKSVEERKQYIGKVLHSKGLHFEAFKCNAYDSYVNHNTISKTMVMHCIKNHVCGKKDCICIF